MITLELLQACFNSIKDPFVFVDTSHIIRFMNQAAAVHYEKGFDLIGNSVLDCHNEESRKIIIEILSEMFAGLEEKLITDNDKQRIYMRVVRDAQGMVLGYYERYEAVTAKQQIKEQSIRNDG
ncbi:PAS domain-containing protein [candidate division CSSED10-310 bacterium]|uniref:PAS domain-containing protein n=1 Tax=candidate division CSSED10-310 bacterium TaxID=2855610 RepID=A0ABV6Z164_UNCC1